MRIIFFIFVASLFTTSHANAQYSHSGSQTERENMQWLITSAGKSFGAPTLARLLLYYDLTDELRLRPGQEEKIDEIVYLEPADVEFEVEDAFKKPMREFKRLLEKKNAKWRASVEATNDQVKEILDNRQLNRLRQLGFQKHVFQYPSPEVAFAYHEESMPADKVKDLRWGWPDSFSHRFPSGTARYLGNFYLMNALPKIIGYRELDRLAGDWGTLGIPIGNRPSDLQLKLLKENELPKDTSASPGRRVVRVAAPEWSTEFLKRQELAHLAMTARFHAEAEVTTKQKAKLKNYLDDSQSRQRIRGRGYIPGALSNQAIEEAMRLEKEQTVEANMEMLKILSARQQLRLSQLLFQSDVELSRTWLGRGSDYQSAPPVQLTSHLLRTLENNGVELSEEDRMEVLMAEKAAATTAESRVHELTLRKATEKLETVLGKEETERLMGEPCALMLHEPPHSAYEKRQQRIEASRIGPTVEKSQRKRQRNPRRER